MREKDFRRQFEIAYNFDKNLVHALYAMGFNRYPRHSVNDYGIYCFYVSPYYQDAEVVLRDILSQDNLRSYSREEYNSHLDLINEKFPGTIQLLLNGKTLFNDEKIMEYHNRFNINKFCVNNDVQASIIRRCIPDADITASITMCLTSQEIKTLDTNLYDNVVLFFPFNKNYKAITELPDKFNYIIIINSACDAKCDGLHHWNMTYEELNDHDPICPRCGEDKETSILIRPMDLKHFDKYIFAYKLQDRSWTVMDICKYLMMAVGEEYFDLMPGIEEFDPDRFYNLK